MRIFGRVDEDDQVSNVYDNRWHMELLVKQNWIGHFTRSFHIERKKNYKCVQIHAQLEKLSLPVEHNRDTKYFRNNGFHVQ